MSLCCGQHHHLDDGSMATMNHDYEEMKKDAEPFIKFEKDVANRIAYITFDRPDELNSTTMGMRQNFADMIHKCNVDDDVKVVVIRGEGNDFGSGGDLPEQREMLENREHLYCTNFRSTMTA